MKKLVLLLFSIILFSSCNECYCPYCDCYYYDSHHCNCHNTQKNDVFYADKLLGTWQMNYGCIVAFPTNGILEKIELKEINFLSCNTCDIMLSQINTVDRYTYTFNYSYYNGYLKFIRNNQSFSFKIDGYLFPELYLSDSYGKYTWKKIKSYGC